MKKKPIICLLVDDDNGEIDNAFMLDDEHQFDDCYREYAERFAKLGYSLVKCSIRGNKSQLAQVLSSFENYGKV